MRRARARVLAAAIVGAITVGTAYASFVVTPSPTAQSSALPVSIVGDVVFSIRNDNATPVMITGFSTMFPAASDTNACGSLSISPSTAMLGSGQEQQFRVDATAGFPAVGDYSCTYQAITNPAIVPAAQVTVRFTVAAVPSAGNVQPTAIDFGNQGSTTFEQQQLFTTIYGGAGYGGLWLNISGDVTSSIVFGPPCDNQLTCNVTAPPVNSTATVPLKCAAKASGTFSANVDVYGNGSGSSYFGTTSVTCAGSAFGGTLTFSPDPLVIVGPSGTQSTPVAVMVNPVGSGSAVLTSASVVGDPTIGIVECGNTSSCSNLSLPFPATLDVYCTPSGSTFGTLSAMDSAGGSGSVTVQCTAMTGSGGPYMTVAPPSINFAGTAVGSSATDTVTIGNQGNAQLDTIEVAVGGIDPGDFSVMPCSTGNPCSLGSNSIQTVTVTFSPQAIGARSALLTVTSNDLAHSPQTVTLNGSGTGAILAIVDPSNNDLDFGTIPRGQAFPRTIVIGDPGNAPLTATISGVTGVYSAAPSSVPVPAQGSNTIQITCQSQTASSNNDQTFTVTSAEAYSGSPQMITAHCAIADTLVQVMPTMLDFGEHRVGSPEATLDVTLTNPASASAPASIHHVQLASAKTGLSLMPADTTMMLGVGSSATVALDLVTGAETDLAGEELDVDVDGAMLQIPVTGKVVAPASRVAPASLDLGTACVGTHVAGTVSLINTGTATLHLADPPTMDQNFNAAFVMPSTYPATLAPGATAVTTVSPAMSATGVVMGTLDWKDDVPSDYHVPVTLDYVMSGTAVSPASLDFGTVEVGQPGSSQQITIQNCDLVPTKVTIRSLRSTQGPIGAWQISPTIGNAAQLGAKGVETVTAHFEPPGRGRYQAELVLDTPEGLQKIRLIGEGTGKELDDTSVYACSCSGTGAGAGGGWPIGLALLAIVRPGRRRRGASSPR